MLKAKTWKIYKDEYYSIAVVLVGVIFTMPPLGCSLFLIVQRILLGFPGGWDGKESACNAGDTGSMPRSGRYAGKGNGNPLQYSCLENPITRRA